MVHATLEEATEVRESAHSTIQSYAADEEEEDIANVIDEDTGETKQHTIQCFPSQASTPRDRKKNIREVDEHDDYGGALLSSLERDLLSTSKSPHGHHLLTVSRKEEAAERAT
jgi:hypothetical protein